MNDDEIQKMIDEKLPGSAAADSFGNDRDVNSYAMLFEALNQEPTIPLRYNFAERITASIHAKKSRANDLKLYLALALGFLVMVAASLFYMGSFTEVPASQFIVMLIKYKWTVVFGIGMLIMIQYLDRKLVGNQRL